MKITAKQAAVLENLHRVEFEQRRGKLRATLDGKDCGSQITTLMVRRLIALDAHGRLVKIAEPEGVHDAYSHWRQKAVTGHDAVGTVIGKTAT